MTAELYPESSPDEVNVVVSWLLPLGGRVWAKRPLDQTLPYTQVRTVSGIASVEEGYSDVVVSISCYGETFEDAKGLSDDVHRRMLELIFLPLHEITMPDGRTACVDSASVFQMPQHLDYGDTGTERFVARYQLCLSFVSDE